MLAYSCDFGGVLLIGISYAAVNLVSDLSGFHSTSEWGTVRNLMMAWVLTLPVAMLLSGLLFWGFRHIF